MKSSKNNKKEFDQLIEYLKRKHEAEKIEPFNAFEGIKSVEEFHEKMENDNPALTDAEEILLIKRFDDFKKNALKKKGSGLDVERLKREFLEYRLPERIVEMNLFDSFMTTDDEFQNVKLYDSTRIGARIIEVEQSGIGTGCTDNPLPKFLYGAFVFSYTPPHRPWFRPFRRGYFRIGALVSYNGLFQLISRKGECKGVYVDANLSSKVFYGSRQTESKTVKLFNRTYEDYNFSDNNNISNYVRFSHDIKMLNFNKEIKIYVSIHLRCMARGRGTKSLINFSGGDYHFTPIVAWIDKIRN